MVGAQGPVRGAGIQEARRRRGRAEQDNSLRQWTEEDWDTASGRKSTKTRERYLPKKARQALSDGEYRSGGPSKSELYDEARSREIPGRSRMSKDELQQALSR